MPFDDTRAVSETHGEIYLQAPLAALPFVPGEPDDVAKRRERIERTVSVIAGVLFGALGALAGVAVVVLMLVALVIPATTALAFGIVAVSAIVAAAVVWMKRRSGKFIDADDGGAVGLSAS